MPKVIALVKYDRKGASSRVRFWNLVAPLAERGWDIEFIPLLNAEILDRYYRVGKHNYINIAGCYLKRLQLIYRQSAPDLWWIEKEILHGMPLLVEQVLAPFVRRAVVDYDDAVFLNYRDGRLGALGRYAKFASYAQKAAHVTVGSGYLRKRMQEWGGNRITTIPSTVHVSNYSVHVHAGKEVVVIGWIGTPVTVAFLDTLKQVLPVLAQRVKFVLHVVGAEWNCPGVDVVCHAWSEENETKLVSSFDVGIMPLIAGEWEEGKCGYKLIQYMAAGVVPVGERVGENSVILDEGETGFLAGCPDEWLTKLERVCRDSQLRAKIGAHARQKALRYYDVSCAAEQVHEVFSRVVQMAARSEGQP